MQGFRAATVSEGGLAPPGGPPGKCLGTWPEWTRPVRPDGDRRRAGGARRRVKIEPAAHLEGHIAVPGDKSISHRALLIGALCEGETRVRGWGRSGDTESTLAAVRALGVRVDEVDVDTLVVHGAGLRGLRAPDGPIDCGNAGTLARLVIGILAFQPGRFELVGDESLSRRPMERVAEPLRRMGAQIESTGGCLPLAIDGRELEAVEYHLPVASAQVKSAILLAGLGAPGRTTGARAGGDARPHRADAGRGRRARHRPRKRGHGRGRPDAAADRGSRAGRHLVGRAVPRRRRAAARLPPDRARHRPQPAADRPAGRARADGRAHCDSRAPSRRGRADRRRRDRGATARRDEDPGRRGAAARRRAAALRAARRVRARQELRERRRGAAR